MRNLLRLPDLVAIFLTVPTSEHRQRLGDRAARTVVLRAAARTRRPAAAAAAVPPNASASWGAGRVFAGLALLLLITVLAAGIASAFDPDLETLGAVLVLQALLAGAMVFVPFQVARADGLCRRGRTGPRALPPRAGATAVLAYAVYIGCALVISALLLARAGGHHARARCRRGRSRRDRRRSS